MFCRSLFVSADGVSDPILHQGTARAGVPLQPRDCRRRSGATTQASGTREGERVATNDDYARGRRDGLRLALATLAAEEAKWAALLGESESWRTNATREVRHKTLRVAQTRVQTVLNRLTPKDDPAIDEEVAAALDRLGL
jgi:hypothetical protein